MRSWPRKRGGGFTFEVQHLGEGLGRGLPVKAFSRGVVVSGDQLLEADIWQRREIGLARNEAPHPPDRILDAALLPGRVRVAEEGIDRKTVQPPMAGELGAVVEGDGAAQACRQRGADGAQGPGATIRRSFWTGAGHA